MPLKNGGQPSSGHEEGAWRGRTQRPSTYREESDDMPSSNQMREQGIDACSALMGSKTMDTYPNRLIVFVDILGFGSLVAASGVDAATEVATIARISQAICQARQELKELSEDSELEFTHFSDSFVVSLPGNLDRTHVAGFTMCVATLVDVFLEAGLLVRGGVTFGKVIHTFEILFGPAMNRAYQIERDLAKYPRIVFDPICFQPGLLDPKRSLHRLAQDDDGMVYLDYFRPSRVFYLLPNHWLSIQDAIEMIPSADANVAPKRDWMIRHYNDVLAERFSLEAFERRLAEYLEDTDSNPEAHRGKAELLACARALHRLS